MVFLCRFTGWILLHTMRCVVLLNHYTYRLLHSNKVSQNPCSLNLKSLPVNQSIQSSKLYCKDILNAIPWILWETAKWQPSKRKKENSNRFSILSLNLTSFQCIHCETQWLSLFANLNQRLHPNFRSKTDNPIFFFRLDGHGEGSESDPCSYVILDICSSSIKIS